MSEYRTVPSVEDGLRFHDASHSTTIAVDYQPGNGTRYRLVVAPISKMAGLELFSMRNQGYLLHWEGHSAFTMERPKFLSWRTIAAGFKCNKADAVVLAEMLGVLLRVPSTTTESASQEDRV